MRRGLARLSPTRLYGTHAVQTASLEGIDGVDEVQARYLLEPCIEVSAEDEVIGSVSKLDCHRALILHRAFSVFIFNPARELLLQKRSSTKITFPDTWTNTCCSHPHFIPEEMENQNVVGIRRAAKRKLFHELGIQNVDIGQMHFMGRFIYRAKSHPAEDDVGSSGDAAWMEHEMDYALVIPNYEGELVPNSEEVSGVRYVNPDQLEAMLSDRSYAFSPWFRLFAQFQWLSRWWHALDDLNSVKTNLTTKIHQLN